MGKNTKPMLTVLVEGDKLQQFRDYALSKEVSMGWVINRLLDRVLSGELDVMGDTVSTGTTREYTSTGLTREDVDSMIKSSIDNQLISSSRKYIEELTKSYIDSLGISSTSTNDIEELTRASIEIALEPIKESVSKLEAEVRAISDRTVVPTTDSLANPLQGKIAKSPTLPPQEKPDVDGNTKTWGEFFKMVGIEAMTAVEAQKKQDTETRTKQIEIGLQAATDQGLGEWAVKRAGRDFMRV
jgi:LPS O-antigen subunit length determinant protein (WzzB/FepE family)